MTVEMSKASNESRRQIEAVLLFLPHGTTETCLGQWLKYSPWRNTNKSILYEANK